MDVLDFGAKVALLHLLLHLVRLVRLVRLVLLGLLSGFGFRRLNNFTAAS